MRHVLTQNSDVVNVKISDKLAFDDHDNFRDLLSQISASGSKKCVMDLAELNTIDSAGLGMLMIAHETSEKENWDFVISKPQGMVRRMLEITEFNKLMTVED